MKKLMKCLNIIMTCTLVLLLSINVYFLFYRLVLKNDLPKLFGFCTAEIIGDSMEPMFSKTDFVVYQEQNEYEVGDVVLYRDESNNLVTHKLTRIEDGIYYTTGLVTMSEDAPKTIDDIEAKYLFKIPKFMSYIQSPFFIIVLIVIGFLIIEIPYLYRKDKK